MNAEIEEIESELYNVSIGVNENETGYVSASSGSGESDSFDGDDEEDDASEHSEGAASKVKSIEERSPSRNDVEADIADPKDAPLQDDIEDDDEGSSSSSEATLQGSEPEEYSDSEPHSTVFSDRGAGDADRLLDSNMFVVAEDSSDHGEIRTQILARRRQHDPEAYQKWILAKNEEIRRNREQEKLQRQQLEEQKRIEAEQRKEKNKLKVQQWMERKKRSERVGTNSPKLKNTQDPQSYEQKFLQKDAEVKYNAWLKRIKQQDKEKMQKKLLERQMAQKAREEKMKVAQEVYQRWLKSSRNKPLPVPLNQGPNTLRGTVSEIFVNPEPWKSNFD